MTFTKAANELQAIRNELVRGNDRKALLARCDAVGQWAAKQKYTDRMGRLCREASETADRITGSVNLPDVLEGKAFILN